MEISSLVLFNDKDQVLVVRDRYEDFWTLPGGKVEKGESKRDAIRREMSEELPLASWANLQFYGEFFGITPHSRVCVVVTVFCARYTGGLVRPHQEITGAKWIDNEWSDGKMTQSTKNIINSFYMDQSLKSSVGP